MDETVKELLKNVRVASPCSERWDGMPGSDQVRSCERCRHKVYNLSEMTAPEAADLLRNAEGRLCVRFYRRADGTVMTKDCPVGLRAVRQRMARGIGIAFASLLTFSVFNLRGKPRSEYPVMLRLLLNVVAPEPPMGDVLEAVPRPAARAAGKVTVEEALPLPAHPAMMGKIACRPPGKSSFGSAPPAAISNDLPPVTIEVAPPPVSAPPSNIGKPFLVGLPVDNSAPRADPFAKLPGAERSRR